MFERWMIVDARWVTREKHTLMERDGEKKGYATRCEALGERRRYSVRRGTPVVFDVS
jgi:hypothetical protein